MASVEKISIALTPEFAGLIREAVASGEYASTSEVIRDALRGWKARRAEQDLDIQDLDTQEVRRLWRDGIASGPGRFRDIDALKREARRRLTERDEERTGPSDP